MEDALNESAKTWAFYEEMPEVQHNAIVGLGLPVATSRATAAVFLRSHTLDHRRIRIRYEFSRRLFADAGIEMKESTAQGESALAHMLSLTLLGDYVAAYLALLYGVDPTPTGVIDELKAWLVETA